MGNVNFGLGRGVCVCFINRMHVDLYLYLANPQWKWILHP